MGLNLLTAENLTKSFHEVPLFRELNISLSEHQKLALIAANGCGKSTLMKMLAGRETPDSGTITMRSGTRVGYLEQEPQLEPDASATDCIFNKAHPVLQLVGEYEAVLEQGDSADPQILQQLTDRMDTAHAWNYEKRAHEILGKLGIHDLHAKVKTLSGGQKKRIALARLLVEDSDLLLLDEPTNHLDLDMIEWLENYLRGLKKAVLLITHDRYFLDNICDSIAEIQHGNIWFYKGNYAYYLEKKAQREEAEASSLEKVKNTYRRELEWMRKQPKARGTKQKARKDSFYKTEAEVKSKRVENRLQFSMQMQRMGSKILEIEYLCKGYGAKTLIENFSHTFRKGEKAGIIGPNGSGKSTLLKMIMGEVKPDKGRVKPGETIVFGYYGQEGLPFKDDKRVIDFAKDIAEYVEIGKGRGKWLHVSQFLVHFGFPVSKQQTFISKLSGGEKRKLHLMSVLIRNPNFLVLDEPTNDLDIVTLNILEDFLVDFEGCILMVTHDRYFMDRLVDHIFVFAGNGLIRDYNGNYTDYRVEATEQQKEKSKSVSQPEETQASSRKEKKGLSYNEKRELENLETSLAGLESKKMDLLELMNSGTSDHEALRNAAVEFEKVSKEIENKMNRWIELSDKL